MNSLQFNALKIRVFARLREKGPATVQALASELEAPQGNVQFALEQLSKADCVVRLSYGLWDAAELIKAA
jgi:predicted transcriptional regulator